MIQIANLWESSDPKAWSDALERYWGFVKPENLALERSLETLDLDRIRRLDVAGWFDFLKNEYFRWKYTAPNRYASTTRLLQRYVDSDSLGQLDEIRSQLLALDVDNARTALKVACAICGLGTAGASGLLSLMYPQQFGTVDQFVVKALRLLRSLPELPALARMNPAGLTIRDGVLIIGVLRRKAAENNSRFRSTTWSPRKIDMVLWTYGR